MRNEILKEPDFIQRDINIISSEMKKMFEEKTQRKLLGSQAEQILLDICAYREHLVRCDIQRAAKETLVEYANNEALDHIGILLGVKRHKDSNDEENDDDLRERIKLAMESFSTAGTRGSYEYWTRSVNSEVTDVYIRNNVPYIIEIYPLLENMESYYALPEDIIVCPGKATSLYTSENTPLLDSENRKRLAKGISSFLPDINEPYCFIISPDTLLTGVKNITTDDPDECIWVQGLGRKREILTHYSWTTLSSESSNNFKKLFYIFINSCKTCFVMYTPNRGIELKELTAWDIKEAKTLLNPEHPLYSYINYSDTESEYIGSDKLYNTLDSIEKELNSLKVKPMGDYIQVKAPVKISVNFIVNIEVKKTYNLENIESKVNNLLENYFLKKSETLGTDIIPGRLEAKLFQIDGIYDAKIIGKKIQLEPYEWASINYTCNIEECNRE